MDYRGKNGLKVSGNNIWHEGNFNPSSKSDAGHTHTKAQITDMPTKLSQFENDENYVTQAELGDVGYGDMMKSVYDKNNDGVVDKAKTVAGPVTWNQLRGVV